MGWPRMFDLRFPQLKLTAYEKRKLQGLGPAMSGFLAWRRSTLRPVVLFALLGIIFRTMSLVITYGPVSPRNFLSDYFGSTLWNTVFCLSLTCKAVESLSGIMYAQAAADALLLLVFIVALVLLVRATRQWHEYRRSSSHVRYAYSATFFAPFVLLLLLPSAQFVDVQGLQQALCLEHTTKLFSMELANALPAKPTPAELRATCEKPINEWGTTFASSLNASACSSAVQAAQSALSSQQLSTLADAAVAALGECEDKGAAAFAAAGNPGGLQDCAQVVASPLGICTLNNPTVRQAVTLLCPRSPPPVPLPRPRRSPRRMWWPCWARTGVRA